MIDVAKNSTRLLGVILAGGSSRRMGGQDKFLLPLAGKSILDHIIERLRPQVDELILNANSEHILTDIKVIPDLYEPVGPMAGLYTALSYAKDNGFEKVVTVASDTPFIPDDFSKRLLEKAQNKIVVAKSNDRIHPVLALWDVSLLDELTEALNDDQRKMMSWISRFEVAEVCWNNSPDPFFNINTPEDLKEAENLSDYFFK